MTAQRQSWEDEERAQRYAKQSRLESRIVYAPLAKKIVQSLGALEEGATIVDLGTGPGLLTVEIHRLWPGAKYIGIDPSGEMLSIASKNASAAGIAAFEAKLGSAEEIPLADASADLVVSQSSFHEWDEPHKGLSEIFRVLKPGGSLILRDYNAAWLTPWKRRLLGRIHHLDMFKFTFEQAAGLAREAEFAGTSGKDSGLQWFMRAVKPA